MVWQGVLKYYKGSGDDKEAGTVDCRDASLERTGDRTFALHTALRVLMLRAATDDDIAKWVRAFEDEFSVTARWQVRSATRRAWGRVGRSPRRRAAVGRALHDTASSQK